MAKVVQCIGGYGKMDPQFFARNDEELKKPSTYMKRVRAEGAQYKYDYRYHRTHGVTAAADGRLWLTEVSANTGMVAVPLPMIHYKIRDKWVASDSDEFREHFARDKIVTKLLDDIGCLPSGEPFPLSTALEEMLQDGRAIRLLTPQQVAPFYDLSPFGTCSGWAWNDEGTAAVNCGYTYPDNDPYQISELWHIRCRIGATKNGRATGSASIYRSHRGKLRSNKFGLPFKYYEPALDAVINHIALPQRMAKLPYRTVYNGPLWGAYINNELKVAQWFMTDFSEVYNEVQDDREGEECFYSGSWSWQIVSGNRTVAAGVWTNDYDNRRAGRDTVTTGTMTAKQVGKTGWSCGNDPIRPNWGSCITNALVQTEVEEKTRRGETYGAIMCVPGGHRAAYCFWMAHYDAQGSSYSHSRGNAVNVAAPYTITTWRNWPSRQHTRGQQPGNKADDPTWACEGWHEESKVVQVEDNSADQDDCRSTLQFAKPLSLCTPTDNLRNSIPRTPPSFYDIVPDAGHNFEGTVYVQYDGIEQPLSRKLTMNEYEYAQVPSPSEFGNLQGMYWHASTIGGPKYYSFGFAEGGTIGRAPFSNPDRASPRSFIGAII